MGAHDKLYKELHLTVEKLKDANNKNEKEIKIMRSLYSQALNKLEEIKNLLEEPYNIWL